MATDVAPMTSLSGLNLNGADLDREAKLAAAKKRLQKFRLSQSSSSSAEATVDSVVIPSAPQTFTPEQYQEAVDRAGRLEREVKALLDTVASHQEEASTRALRLNSDENAALKKATDDRLALQQELDATVNEHALLKLQLGDAHRLNGELSSQVSKLENKLRQEAASQAVLMQAQNSNEQVQQLQGQKLHLEKQLYARNEDVRNAEGELAASKGKIYDLQHELAQQKVHYHDAVEELAQLKQSLALAQSELVQSTVQTRNLQEQLTGAQQQLSASPATPATSPEIVAAKDTVIAQLQSEVERLTEDSRERSRLNNRLRENTEQTERLMVENRSLYEQLTELRDRFVQISNEKMELADQLLSEKGRASKHVVSVQAGPPLSKFTELEAERDRLRVQLEEEQYMTERLRMEIETIPDYISMYHKERSALKAKFLEQERVLADLTLIHQKTIRQLVQAREALEGVTWENKQLRQLAQAEGFESTTGSSADAIMLSDTLPMAADADYVIQELKKDSGKPTTGGPFPSMGKRVLAFPPCAHCVGISFYI